jgi:glycosyltransferase involved in cell wall biosynthesis
MHIGLNAHLLTNQAGYRSAGIHGYMSSLMRSLPAAAPHDWRFTAMMGASCDLTFPDINSRHSRLDTRSPLRRIAWEQAIQPWQLGDFDLVHAQAFVSPLLSRKPHVITVYDLSFVHFPQVLSAARRLYLRLFTPISCARARRVIAISQSTADDLVQTFGLAPAKIDVALGGYDSDRFMPLPVDQIEEFRTANGLPKRFWLFLGTLEPRKNLVTLLEAYARLPKSERLPLVLAGGKGWLYDDIFQAIDRHNLKSDVILPGFVSAESLPLWYNSAEVFVLPSIFEGFGLPVLEAMACGKPVIIANASSLPEIVGALAIKVPPTDTDAWTVALRTAFHDDNWRTQAGLEGRALARALTWQATAQTTIETYRKALREQPS